MDINQLANKCSSAEEFSAKLLALAGLKVDNLISMTDKGNVLLHVPYAIDITAKAYHKAAVDANRPEYKVAPTLNRVELYLLQASGILPTLTSLFTMAVNNWEESFLYMQRTIFPKYKFAVRKDNRIYLSQTEDIKEEDCLSVDACDSELSFISESATNLELV